MKKFNYEVTVQASSQQESDQKMKALFVIFNKLSAEELTKVAEVVSNPVQFAIIKSKLL